MRSGDYLKLAVGAGALAAAAMTATTHFDHPPAAEPTVSITSSPSGLGGAGAFIPAGHFNGVFGAGGPAAGLGGAGAFTPKTTAAP